jgi:hypothetical protein
VCRAFEFTVPAVSFLTPRVTSHDDVQFEEVSVGYPREWQRRLVRGWGGARDPGVPRLRPAPAGAGRSR